MAKQKKGEVTLEELITLRNSAQLALDVVDGMIAELAMSMLSDATRTKSGEML